MAMVLVGKIRGIIRSHLTQVDNAVAGKRSITADTDLRLCRYFGLSDGWWLRCQTNYDTILAKESIGENLSNFKRCELLAAKTKRPGNEWNA